MEKYRDIGLKLTPQRLAILEYLEGNTNHPSAESIYNEIRKKFPMISFATVYKTLETLKNKGNLKELTIDPERRRYDPDTGPHHHLICVECKRIVDIHNEFPLHVPDGVDSSFEITGNHIEFYGTCPECKARQMSNNQYNRKENVKMSVFKCESCGSTKEGRCKPKKCPKCGDTNTMKKKE